MDAAGPGNPLWEPLDSVQHLWKLTPALPQTIRCIFLGRYNVWHLLNAQWMALFHFIILLYFCRGFILFGSWFSWLTTWPPFPGSFCALPLWFRIRCFLSSCDLGCSPQRLPCQLGSAVSHPAPWTLLGRPRPHRWALRGTVWRRQLNPLTHL